jgi:hypothetical protein
MTKIILTSLQQIPSNLISSIAEHYHHETILNISSKTVEMVFKSHFQSHDKKMIQDLAEKNAARSYVKKGNAYSSESINNELDRLVDLFRSNGYYYFTKEKIFAEVDTMNTSLMKLNLDPLAQINQQLI